jgi:hypothetical protein
VNLNSVETSFSSQIDSLSISTRHFRKFFFPHSAHKGRRVKIETGRSRDRSYSTNVLVGHITAMTDLYTCCGTLIVYGVGHFA